MTRNEMLRELRRQRRYIDRAIGALESALGQKKPAEPKPEKTIKEAEEKPLGILLNFPKRTGTDGGTP